jgi:hypothetical protein
MPRDAAAAPPRDAPPAVPTCSLCELPLDQEQEDLGACFAFAFRSPAHAR